MQNASSALQTSYQIASKLQPNVEKPKENLGFQLWTLEKPKENLYFQPQTEDPGPRPRPWVHGTCAKARELYKLPINRPCGRYVNNNNDTLELHALPQGNYK